MLVGNSHSVYYSCAKLSISGGNPRFNCKSDEAPITYPCLRSAGPDIKDHKLRTGALYKYSHKLTKISLSGKLVLIYIFIYLCFDLK